MCKQVQAPIKLYLLAGNEKNSMISQTHNFQFHLVYDLLHKLINPFMDLVM
jgi:hypothetical protein